MNKSQLDYDLQMMGHAPRPAEPEAPIDWDMIAEIFPQAFSVMCWVLWGMFLLIPSVFGLHGVAMFSTADNTVFVMMGFCFCIFQSTAIRAGHGVRAVFFAVGLFLLSIWF